MICFHLIYKQRQIYNKIPLSSTSIANDTMAENKDNLNEQTMSTIPMSYILNDDNRIRIISIVITNVVFSFKINSHLNLKYMAQNGLNVEYISNQKVKYIIRHLYIKSGLLIIISA